MRAEGSSGAVLLSCQYQGTLQMSIKRLHFPGVHLKFHLRQLTGVSAKKIQTQRPQLWAVLPYQGARGLEMCLKVAINPSMVRSVLLVSCQQPMLCSVVPYLLCGP